MSPQRDETFSRENRLRRSVDFQRVFSRGKRTATRYFVIYYLPNHLPFSRLGIQVRARIGTAVKRNYIKRIVREVFRKSKQEFREPIDIIFIAERPMTELNFGQFRSEFLKVLQRYLRQ